MKYILISKENEFEFDSLDQAMTHAKKLAEFVTIKSGSFELVGKFGVDSIENGVCPDGVKYDWDKSSRIGKVRNKKEIYRDETEEDY